MPRRVRTPTVLQMEAVECGAASLGMMLAYHDKWVPLTELRQKCGVSRDGSKASKVVQAARAYGMEAKGFSRDIDAVRAMTPPFVVFWQFNHFLVVEGFDRRGVRLNDPAAGHRWVTHDEFSAGFTGVALQMSPGPDFKPGGRPARMLPAVLARLRGSAKPVLFCLAAGLLLTLPGMVIPVYTSVFVDAVVLGGKADWFRPLVALTAGTVAVMVGLKAIEAAFLRRLRLSLTARLSGAFLTHLLRLPMGFYAQRYAGEIACRIQHNEEVAGVLTGKLAQAAIAAVSMVLYAAVMVCYSPLLTGVAAGFAAVNFVALRLVYHRRVEASMRLAQDQGTAAAVAIAGLQGIETLKATGTEDGFFAKWAGHYGKAAVAHQGLEAGNVTLGVLPTLLEGLSISLVLVVGGLRVIDGDLTLGMLVAFQGLTHNFLAPVGELVHLGGSLQTLHGDLQRLDDVLEQPPDPGLAGPPPEPVVPGAVPAPARPRLSGLVEVENLSFGYSPLDPPLVKNFSLTLRPGQRVALVGGSGSGKSTIAKLITGLYEPWSGAVKFDGLPRAKVPRDLLENSVGYVDQDVTLFEGSVRSNVTLWDRTVPEASVRRALQDAAIESAVMALPGGLDGVLREGGANLSGGQRQRLEIARALVNDPSVLVLDEATSALDTESERLVVEAVRRRGCTCVVVAHRLSTIRDCDEIIVLRFGQVAERGTHAELWAKKGYYAKLIASEESS